MKKRSFIIILSIVLFISLSATVVFAWLVNSLSTDPGIRGTVHKSYFESGDGTSATQFAGSSLSTDEGCAFEIKYPVQLYYFAWLQYLGYFNQPVEGSTSEIQQYYFYLSEDLDMTGWSLPPVGTQTFPFVGNFDGNGHVISNLTIQNVNTTSDSNSTTLNDLPISENLSGAEIIGFFGVVGSLNSSGTVNGAIDNGSSFAPSPNYTYSSQTNEIKNFGLSGTTVKTQTSNSLIGIVAGYVNGEVSNVQVATSGSVIRNSSTSALTAYTNNLSDYTLVGYATEEFRDTSDVVFVTVDRSTQTNSHFNYAAQGSAASWGGSVDMYGLLKRLDAVRLITESAENQADRLTIPKTELVVADPLTGEEEVTVLEYYASDTFRGASNNTFTATGANRLYYFSTREAGSYHVTPWDDGNRHRNYLIGLNTMYDNNTVQQGKTVYTVTWKTSGGNYVYLDAYDYSCGGNYLNLNASQDGLVGGSSATNHWVLDSNGYLYTVTDTYEKVYLNATATLAVGSSGSTVWTWENNKLKYTYNGLTYYLQYNNSWIAARESFYVITDGNGNYLRYYNNALSNTRDITQASHWTFSVTEPRLSGYISVEGTNTYLRYNNGLTVYTGNNYNTNATSWTNSGTSLYTGNNYIKFNGTDWVAGARGTYYAISNGTNYLNITAVNGNTATLGTGASVANISSANGHTLWTFSNTAGNPNGTISASVNGTTYYLRDDNGTLTATTSNATTWSNSGTGLYTGKDYVEYDGDWHITSVLQSIHSGNSYLNITAADGTTATLGTGNSIADNSESNHTMWKIDGNGYIYASYDGVTYYLRNDNGALTATSSAANRTVWVSNGTSIYTGDPDNGYYLQYSSGWSLILRTLRGYTIDYNGNYLNLTNTSTNNNPIGTGTNRADDSDNGHTVWTFENTGTYPSGRMSVKINGTTYYLYGSSNNSVRIAENPGSYYSWTNTNGVLSVRSRYLRYNNGIFNSGWQFSTTNSNNILNFTPIYNVDPTVTVSNGSTPSVTVTSETEPAPAVQPTVVYYDVTDLTRTSSGALHDFTKDGGVMKQSGIPVYIPLKPEGSGDDFLNYRTGDSTDIFNVASGNTGYITSGAYDISDNRRGDVRISAYNITSINNCYTPANGFTRVYTIDGTSGSYNKRQINLTTGVCDATNKKYVRFLASLSQLTTTLQKTNSADQSVYGIHFMDATIDMDHIITAPYAVVDGAEYTDFELPEVAIDFSVHQKGYITFYAGAYHSSNDSLFSLHEIKRNGSKIEWIKEIQYIYSSGDTADDYIYMYRVKNGNTYTYSFSDGLSHPTNGNSFTVDGTTYSLVFNAEWIWTNPGFVTAGQHDVYYFEIPVNKGEYALGSVDGGTGAYLIYLDIAANAQLVDRVSVVENFEEITKTYEVPVGVTFRNTAISPSSTDTVIPSVIASLPTSAASSTVTVTDDTHITLSAGTVGFINDGVTVNSTLNESNIPGPPISTSTTRIRRTTYHDYNVAKNTYTVTVVTVKQVDGGAISVTINAWNTASDWDTEANTATQIASMETGFTPSIQASTNGVAINPGASQTLEYTAVDEINCYLINVSNNQDAETLRIDQDAFEGTLTVSNSYIYKFCYAIKDNSNETNGSTVEYVYDYDISFNVNSETDAGLYTLSNYSYDITVTSTQTVNPLVITDNSIVTLNPTPQQ